MNQSEFTNADYSKSPAENKTKNSFRMSRSVLDDSRKQPNIAEMYMSSMQRKEREMQNKALFNNLVNIETKTNVVI